MHVLKIWSDLSRGNETAKRIFCTLLGFELLNNFVLSLFFGLCAGICYARFASLNGAVCHCWRIKPFTTQSEQPWTEHTGTMDQRTLT